MLPQAGEVRQTGRSNPNSSRFRKAWFVSPRPAWLRRGVAAASNAMRMAAAALAFEAHESPPTKRDGGNNAHSNFSKSTIHARRADKGLPDAIVVRLLDGVARLRASIRHPFADGKLKSSMVNPR